jgi:hypothetical protein
LVNSNRTWSYYPQKLSHSYLHLYLSSIGQASDALGHVHVTL